MWENDLVPPKKYKHISENSVSAHLQLTASFYGSRRMSFIS